MGNLPGPRHQSRSSSSRSQADTLGPPESPHGCPSDVVRIGDNGGRRSRESSVKNRWREDSESVPQPLPRPPPRGVAGRNLTPRPPSLRGKGEQEAIFPPLRFGEGAFALPVPAS